MDSAPTTCRNQAFYRLHILLGASVKFIKLPGLAQINSFCSGKETAAVAQATQIVRVFVVGFVVRAGCVDPQRGDQHGGT